MIESFRGKGCKPQVIKEAQQKTTENSDGNILDPKSSKRRTTTQKSSFSGIYVDVYAVVMSTFPSILYESNEITKRKNRLPYVSSLSTTFESCRRTAYLYEVVYIFRQASTRFSFKKVAILFYDFVTRMLTSRL